MSREALTKQVLELSPSEPPKKLKLWALVFAALGVVGLVLGFVLGTAAGFSALLSATVIVIGLGMVGPLLSAILQMTGAKWGRAYRRVAEGFVMFMPVGLLGMIALLAMGHLYLPWIGVHLHGGKHYWLVRGFWDARIIGSLLLAYGVGLRFVYLSLRKDFCLSEVKDWFDGKLAVLVSKGIDNPEAELVRLEKKMDLLAPFVAIIYCVLFSLLGFDLIMALEPHWYSTLFGAWYFVGNVFVGLALLAIFTVAFRKHLSLEHFFTDKRQSDLATLLFAFVLLNADFFWNQYLTIWYANLPEETVYVVERTVDASLPWRTLALLALAAFFVLPFVALCFRKFKVSRPLLSLVAGTAAIGVILARFIEIAPALMHVSPGGGVDAVILPFVATVLVLVGMLGVGMLLFGKFLTMAPLMPIGDSIFIAQFQTREGSA